MQQQQPFENPTVQLRAHHMLCALTFRSRGYGPQFVKRFELVIDRMMQGDVIQLMTEQDELCYSKENCGLCKAQVSANRDRQALKALTRILPSLLKDHHIALTDADLALLRTAFANSSARDACSGCSWYSVCSREAQQSFRRARLQPGS